MALQIENLSKRYRNNWVLRDIAFTALPGSVYGICGATASGKTSLLNAIAGKGKLGSGKILLDGNDLSQMKSKERPVTLVTREAAAGPIEWFKGGPTASAGELGSQAIEKALVKDADVLLLDEPFCEMDPGLRSKWIDRVRSEADRGRIVIFATSDFDQLAVADAISMLDKGSLSEPQTPKEFYEDPPTVSAARLTGDNNLFEARRLSSSTSDLPEFFTIDGGHRIFAHLRDKRRLGPINSNAILGIRPEQVVMSMGASFPEDNLLRAVVTRIKFKGATSLIEFDAGGLKLETRVFKVVGLQVGDECMLGLPPHRIVILKD
jgi:ABC-type Fe3+/spermidine/putrescine transport system ATPase subunit